jgi:hypothetical protein
MAENKIHSNLQFSNVFFFSKMIESTSGSTLLLQKNKWGNLFLKTGACNKIPCISSFYDFAAILTSVSSSLSSSTL